MNRVGSTAECTPTRSVHPAAARGRHTAVVSVAMTLIAMSAVASQQANAADPVADPSSSSVETNVQGDGSLIVVVHLRDRGGQPPASLSQPWLVIKAVRPPYSGSLGVYTTAPSQVDEVVLRSGGTLG